MERHRSRKKPRPPRKNLGRLPTPEAAPHFDELAPPATEDPEDEERGPLRRCIVTRVSGERARLIRFVLAPDRRIVPDLAAKLPGRGIWLSARADVIETARAKGAFARAVRGPVTVPADLPEILSAGLARRVGECLGLARRAGQAVAGFAKAREWLVQGRAAGVIQAADGSLEERARLLSGARDVWVAWPLQAAALGAVFGRDHVVHVAVAPGRLAAALHIEVERLAGVSGQVLTKTGG
jgi:predicted RNA-binding protein YlxR (DUF448 family)